MILSFDKWILDTCEKFSHKTQRTFGITCFALARICLVFSFLLFSAGSFYEYGFLGIIPPLVSLMPALELYQRTFDVERRTASLALRGFANPNKNMGTLRFGIFFIDAFFVTALFSIGGSATYLLSVIEWVALLILHLYFIACNPLPPAKSEVRKFIEKISEALNPAPVPAPQEL